MSMRESVVTAGDDHASEVHASHEDPAGGPSRYDTATMAKRAPLVARAALRLVSAAAVVLASCAHPVERARVLVRAPAEPAPRTMTRDPAPRESGQVGYATWYGRALAGRRTASGERYDPTQMTAAHRKLPFGTWVEVERLDTGDVVRVRITDRGPFGHDNRIIDLSSAAAARLGMLRQGVARVRLRIVDGP